MDNHQLTQNCFFNDSISIHNEIFDNANIGGGIFDHANIQYQRIQ